MWIVTKTNIITCLTEVNSTHNCSKEALESIKNLITEDSEQKIKKENGIEFIEEYKISRGRVYNSKSLVYNYQIIKVISPPHGKGFIKK